MAGGATTVTDSETPQATGDPPAAEPKAPALQTPEQASEPPEHAPSIDDLLAEYDEAVPSAKAAEPAGDAEPAATADSTGDPAQPAPGVDPRVDPRVDGLIDVVRGQELERLQAQEDADARSVLNDAKQAVAEFAGKLPEDFAERWLTSEYQLNPRLNAAWNQRHDSQAAMARAERAVERALNDLYKAAESVPNAEATADQEAVAAAMRGASGAQPSGAAPDYGRMSDGEFRKSVEDEHGYTRGV
jgi:hypothetical protein